MVVGQSEQKLHGLSLLLSGASAPLLLLVAPEDALAGRPGLPVLAVAHKVPVDVVAVRAAEAFAPVARADLAAIAPHAVTRAVAPGEQPCVCEMLGHMVVDLGGRCGFIRRERGVLGVARGWADKTMMNLSF